MDSLLNGYAAPFVKVYTSAGEITSKITQFIYKYSQEDDDTCQLTFEELDFNIADRPEFQEGVILSIIWGYIGQDQVVNRKVKIVNCHPTFSQDTIKLDLLCTDLASVIKGNSRRKVWNKQDLNSLGQNIAKDHGLDFNGVDVSETGVEVDASGQHGLKSMAQFKQDGNFTAGRDETSIPKKVNLKIHETFAQAGISDFKVLKDMAKHEPEGPMEITGRDGELVIRKIPMNKKPLKAFTYTGKEGLLLEFTPETINRSRKPAAYNITITGFDPETKTAFQGDVNNGNNPNGYPLGNMQVNPTEEAEIKAKQAQTNKVTANDRIKYLKDSFKNTTPLKNANELKGSKPEPRSDVTILRGDDNNVGFAILNTTSPSFYNKDGYSSTAIDETRVYKTFGFDYGKESSGEHKPEDGWDKASNEQAEDAMEINPGSAKVVGDPILRSGEIYTFHNVSKKYSGNYYCTECTHEMSIENGYIVELTLARNALSSIGKDNSPALSETDKANKQEPPTNTQEITLGSKKIKVTDSGQPLDIKIIIPNQ